MAWNLFQYNTQLKHIPRRDISKFLPDGIFFNNIIRLDWRGTNIPPAPEDQACHFLTSNILMDDK